LRLCGEKFFAVLRANEEEHYRLVAGHMEKHLEVLGVPRASNG